jgi:uncharacterized protein YndB with AHSA1/START domain
MATEILSIRRIIKAPPQKVFAAWTTPSLLMKWWGPAGVVCPQAEIDLRPNGAYRICNRHPDGSTTWIHGVFERVEPPSELISSWNLGMPGADGSRVRVRFVPHPEGTELLLAHERLETAARAMHLEGWTGCLEKLEGLFAG